jgi:hypothetical protein
VLLRMLVLGTIIAPRYSASCSKAGIPDIGLLYIGLAANK